MAKSKDSSQVAAASLEDLAAQLNLILPRIFDRLDQLEGLRDSFETHAGGTFSGTVKATAVEVSDDESTVVHSLGEN